jgi:tRNA 2-thiouridine synthesizing protein E
MNINNKEIELDAEGYLIHPEDWDKDVALALAKSENIILDDTYFLIIDFMRHYYNEHGVIPDIRHTAKQFGVDLNIDKKSAKTKLFKMFPYGYVQQTCKIAGMKRPRGWSTG